MAEHRPNNVDLSVQDRIKFEAINAAQAHQCAVFRISVNHGERA